MTMALSWDRAKHTDSSAHLPRLLNRLQHRDVRILIMLFVVALLNLVDLAYTLFAHNIQMLDELNPVAQSFLSTGLTSSLISYKLLMMLCGFTLLWKARRSRLVIPACWLLMAVYFSLAVVWYVWVQDFNHTPEHQFAAIVMEHQNDVDGGQ